MIPGGSLVAIVTPFQDGEIDEKRLRELVRFHIDGGTDGIVAVGTTGESPTLSHNEHKKVIEIVIDESAGKIAVIAGTGSNSTSEALDMTRHAHSAGADGALIVNPYYNKPSQEGIYRHFSTIAESVDIDQLIYNIPGRSAGKVMVDTMVRLSNHEKIVGVKDAVGDLSETSEIIDRIGSDFLVFSGDDALTLPVMALGGAGVISVLANILPAKVKSLTKAMLEGDINTARKINFSTRELVSVLFLETNPVPVKSAMAMMGMLTEEFRLPLCQMSQKNRERLILAIRKAGLQIVSEVIK